MIQSVKHAINVINCFSLQTPELGVSDLAARLDMNVSTVHHIVKTLYNEGVLVKTQSRRYRLGSPFLNWGRLVSDQYRPYFVTIPYLETLAKRENETIHLAIIENEEVSYLAKIETISKPNRVVTNIGLRKPLCSTAMGKVLLANQSRKIIQKVVGQGMPGLPPDAGIDDKSFLKELQQIREQGYSIGAEHPEPTAAELHESADICIAAPIRDVSGVVVCAIGITGPESRINEKLESTIQNLFLTASTISDHCDFPH